MCVSHDSSIISFAPRLRILRLCKFSLEEKHLTRCVPATWSSLQLGAVFEKPRPTMTCHCCGWGMLGYWDLGWNSDFLLTQICGYLWRNHVQDLSPCIPIWLWPNHWKEDPGTHLIQLRKDKDHGTEQVYASCANLKHRYRQTVLWWYFYVKRSLKIKQYRPQYVPNIRPCNILNESGWGCIDFCYYLVNYLT